MYEFIHNLIDMPLFEAGCLHFTSCTRASGLKLFVQRSFRTLFHNFFSFKAVTLWNSPPCNIINCQSLLAFRTALYKHLSLPNNNYLHLRIQYPCQALVNTHRRY